MKIVHSIIIRGKDKQGQGGGEERRIEEEGRKGGREKGEREKEGREGREGGRCS